MARKIFFCIFVVSLIVMFYAYAGEVKLTTYYPAPYGEYKKVVTKTLGVGDTNKDGSFNGSDAPDPATNPGDVWIAGNLQFAPTTSATVGVLTNGTYPLLHTYHDPATDGYNVFIGGAGNFTMWRNSSSEQASYNNAIGINALHSNTTGQKNNAIGAKALYANTTGYHNNAIGDNALASNTAGYENDAMGYQALLNNTTGNYNTAIGFYALKSNTTGNSNTAMGPEALGCNTTGSKNTAVGSGSLYVNQTGSQNTAVGDQSLYYNTSGIGNTGMGESVLYNNRTGHQNTAVGTTALYHLSSGSGNVAIGYVAGQGITTGNYNTIIGNAGGLPADMSNNIIIADGQGHQRIQVDSSGKVTIPHSASIANWAEQSIGTNGYAWIGNLLFQWGYAISTKDGVEAFAFPITFPNQCFGIHITRKNPQANHVQHVLAVATDSTSGFTINRDSTIDGNEPFYFLAIGH